MNVAFIKVENIIYKIDEIGLDLSFMPLAEEGLIAINECGFKVVALCHSCDLSSDSKIRGMLCKKVSERLRDFVYEIRCFNNNNEYGKINDIFKELVEDLKADKKVSFVVGDRETDVELGIEVGLEPLLVISRKNEGLLKYTKAERFFGNLYEVARWVCFKLHNLK